MSTEHDEMPDGEMSPEQRSIASSLTPEFILKIDSALLAQADDHYFRKVARIIGTAMSDTSIRVPGLPDLFYRDRVKVLVEKGALLAEGDLNRMRYSEVKRANEH